MEFKKGEVYVDCDNDILIVTRDLGANCEYYRVNDGSATTIGYHGCYKNGLKEFNNKKTKINLINILFGVDTEETTC